MKYFFYTVYRSGAAGLSNLIMSMEIGVILAHLTNRSLVLEGNSTPEANIVSYGRRVDNRRPSRVTDLIELPVAWSDADAINVADLESYELTDRSLGDVAFYFPRTLDLSSSDARAFARGRNQWLTVTGELDRIPLLRLSEDPFVPRPGTERRRNLGFYSYLFYLDDETRRSVYRLLARMVAKPPFADLARRVADEIGPFNAVHLRRGDFKISNGVTTLDRQPWEAIDALDRIFDRRDPLVILTDEQDDPFLREIRLAYPHHCFIDTHILDAYGAEFAMLPQTDSLCLAFLSQLVAAESKNFIGTMTSTFTAMIQRYRGNRGKHEPFRFLWNELPAPGAVVERGRHPFSDCIPLEHGVMVEESDGPYSWNRVNQRLSPFWMREWPESFLTPETLDTGRLATARASGARRGMLARLAENRFVVWIRLENLSVAVRAADADLLREAGLDIAAASHPPAPNVIADIEIGRLSDGYEVVQDNRRVGQPVDPRQLRTFLTLRLVTAFARARPWHSWFRGAAFTRAGRVLLVVRALDDGGAGDSLAEALPNWGWTLVEQGAIAIRAKDLAMLTLGLTSAREGATSEPAHAAAPLAHLVVAARSSNVADTLASLGPAMAVTRLIPASLDYLLDRDRAVERLCRLVERQPVNELSFTQVEYAVQLLARLHDRGTTLS